ncbi:MAG: ATP-binding cassette domain-containing protein [Bacillota bacterium]|nr:ATP-binding cassette domain-containing protein [Bacillota bacterium]
MSILIEDLNYIYDPGTIFEKQALKDISLSVEKGSICGIMGMTGCGKTTLIQMIAGLYTPTSGKVIIDGEDINDPDYDRLKLRSRLGIVFQYPESQLFETTAFKDVAFGLKHSGLSDEEKTENIRWALEVTGFDFEKIKDKSPLSLSGGEKRRLAIAGVLAVKPDYLLLDEPFAGLDPVGRERFVALLKGLNREGMTIIIVSHNADAVAECVTDLVIMKGGSIVLKGEVHDVFGNKELLRECGVQVSSAAWTGQMLTEKGTLAESRAITIDELVSELTAALGERT